MVDRKSAVFVVGALALLVVGGCDRERVEIAEVIDEAASNTDSDGGEAALDPPFFPLSDAGPDADAFGCTGGGPPLASCFCPNGYRVVDDPRVCICC